MNTKKFKIINLHCANCASKIIESMKKIPEIKEIKLNFYYSEVTVVFKEAIYTPDQIADTINKLNLICDQIEPGTFLKEVFSDESDIQNNSSTDSTPLFGEEDSFPNNNNNEENSKPIFLQKVISFVKTSSIAISLVLFFCYFFIDNSFLKYFLLFLAYALCGSEIIFKSYKNIIRGNFLDENFLMTIATLGAFAIGDFSEGVAVMIFYKIGEFFQDKAVDNSKKSIEKLLNLKAVYANLKLDNGDIIKVAPEKIKIGDVITVKTGEKIPLDGELLDELATIDNSALTGESVPITQFTHDKMLSGGINIGNTFNLKVSKLFKDSTVSKIIDLVKNSNEKKPISEKFITKFARIYTPTVVLLAILIAIIPPFIWDDSFSLWFGRGLIFLVISCPCALVLSIPLTFFSSIGYASKNGILIKGGNYLETLSKIDTIVFDKTGTLTYGKFKIDEIIPTNGVSSEEVLLCAKAGEYFSNHPIAKAILDTPSEKLEITHLKNHKEFPGKGIKVNYFHDEIIVGNSGFLSDFNIKVQQSDNYQTAVYVAKNNLFLGTILLSDEVRKNVSNTIKKINSLEMSTYILTGDTSLISSAIGEKVGIPSSRIFPNLLPKDKVKKLEYIKSLSKKGVIFVGDGINDAPVLALANIGIAMGGIGSDIAIEAADIVIMNDDLEKIPFLLNIAKKNRVILSQNITLALGIKIIVMILGILGFANLWLAIFADVGVSLLAVLNASKILKRQL